MLDEIRRTIGEYNFAGQYQQPPAPLGGGLVKPAWFKRYLPEALPSAFERVVQVALVTGGPEAGPKRSLQGASHSALLAPRGTRGTAKDPGVPDMTTWSVTP